VHIEYSVWCTEQKADRETQTDAKQNYSLGHSVCWPFVFGSLASFAHFAYFAPFQHSASFEHFAQFLIGRSPFVGHLFSRCETGALERNWKQRRAERQIGIGGKSEPEAILFFSSVLVTVCHEHLTPFHFNALHSIGTTFHWPSGRLARVND